MSGQRRASTTGEVWRIRLCAAIDADTALCTALSTVATGKGQSTRSHGERVALSKGPIVAVHCVGGALNPSETALHDTCRGVDGRSVVSAGDCP